jgi:sarcosine oxidase
VVSARNEPPRHVDVLVIGGGVVGAAAALAAARHGARVALLERASLGSATGSSKGTARIYAPAAHPDESYLEMGLRALERWREIEADAGEQLLWPTGALSVGRFAEHELPLLRAAGVETELLSAAEAWRRCGVRVDEDRPLVYQRDAGVIRATRALGALLRLAREAGVELCGEEPVESIAQADAWVEAVTGRRRWRSSAAIVAAGPWSGGLLAEAGVERPLSVTRQSTAYFALAEPPVRPPALIDYEGDEPYALWDPERGLKAALHARGPLVDADGPAPEVDQDAVNRLAEWVGERFGDLTTGLSGVESCLYTNTPGDRFILERAGRVVVAAACNGQGFQLAPETGERLASLALEPAGLPAR